MTHVLHNFIWGAETKGGGVADVELQDAHALAFHACRFVNNRASNVVQDIVELGGFLELTHGCTSFCDGYSSTACLFAAGFCGVAFDGCSGCRLGLGGVILASFTFGEP